MGPPKLKTPASADPVTLDQAKEFLEYETNDDRDDEITGLIASATEDAQNTSGRQLVFATFQLFLDGFFNDSRRYFVDGCIFLPGPPFRQVVSIKYLDIDGNEQTFLASKYALDSAPDSGRITLAFNESWPSTRLVADAVTIEYVSGYGVSGEDEAASIAAVPSNFKTGIRMAVHAWFNRDAPVGTLPDNARRLFMQRKVA